MVIDPVARALTHLVVEPKRGRKKGRLVPVNLAVPTTDGAALACTTAEFDNLDEAEETQFIPGGSGQFRYGRDQMVPLPYYGLAAGGTVVPGPQVIANDHVPIRRSRGCAGRSTYRGTAHRPPMVISTQLTPGPAATGSCTERPLGQRSPP